MRKPPAHFKPEIKPSTTKKKNVMTATLCIVLALVLIMAVAVTGCNSTNAPESEVSSQTPTATPTAEPTEEPTPTPEPKPTPSPSPEPEDEAEFRWNVPVEKAGITAGFYTDGEEYYFEMSSETSNSATLLNWLSTGLFTKMEPMVERIDIVVQNSTSSYEENGISYSVMEGYGRKWVFYIQQIDGESSAGGPGLIGLRVNKKEEMESCYNGSIGDAQTTNNIDDTNSTNSEDSLSEATLFEDQSTFISKYTTRMMAVSVMQEGYNITVSESYTEDGDIILTHTLNGSQTNVVLSFIDDGILLDSNTSAESDVATTLLCSAAIMFDSSKSVGSYTDAFTVIGEMVAEISESGGSTTRSYDGIDYQLSSTESLQFTAIPTA